MYGSKGLVRSQAKWCSTCRELCAIVYFVTTQFSFNLQGRTFTLRTDHSSLRWLKSFLDKASDVLASWLYYLEPYRPYMKIEHRAGIKHDNADALSRFETRSCPRLDCPDPGHQVPTARMVEKSIDHCTFMHINGLIATAKYDKEFNSTGPSIWDVNPRDESSYEAILSLLGLETLPMQYDTKVIPVSSDKEHPSTVTLVVGTGSGSGGILPGNSKDSSIP